MSPARAVPVSTQAGVVPRHDDNVAQAPGDVLLTARTEVGLARLIRLYLHHLDAVIGEFTRHGFKYGLALNGRRRTRFRHARWAKAERVA